MTLTTPVPLGRPRDPEVDRRILAAALEEFAAEGWRSSSIESIARRAKVGKASIYLRWASKEEILVEAFKANAMQLDVPEVGHIRGALYDMTLQLVQSSVGPVGAAHLRLRTDRDLPQSLSEIMNRIIRDAIESSRRLVKLGQETGELPAGVSPSLFMDCLAGAITNRAVATTFYEGDTPPKPHSKFAQELVDFLLREN